MFTLSIGQLSIFVILVAIAGGIVGYVVANYRQRTACGGKTALELSEELSGYKGDVAQHFQTTAAQLHQMTEQYRALYEHMADGAQQLCDPDDATPQIADLRAGLLIESTAETDGERLSGSVEESSVEYGPESVPSSSAEPPTAVEVDAEHESRAEPGNRVRENIPPEENPGVNQ